jgi:hypothetical protein
VLVVRALTTPARLKCEQGEQEEAGNQGGGGDPAQHHGAVKVRLARVAPHTQEPRGAVQGGGTHEGEDQVEVAPAARRLEVNEEGRQGEQQHRR